VLWDSDTNRYHIYGAENLTELAAHLNKADWLVSFNGLNFDVPCIEGVTGWEITANHYDILDAIWKAVGKKHKGWGLGKVAERTVGLGKTDTGEHAPELARQGRWATLIDYCINDVHITKELFFHILLEGFVVGPDGDRVEIEVPDALR
jgi:uncharacterized protein YprB with RNaseH-like and TPR domain